jgi:hypothetical protein
LIWIACARKGGDDVEELVVAEELLFTDERLVD